MIIDERIGLRARQVGNSLIPVRTVVYVEVGDMAPVDVRLVLDAISQHYRDNEHPVFILPLRGRKLLSDIEFEGEALATVRRLCEIRDGEIQLRGNVSDVDVMRFSI